MTPRPDKDAYYLGIAREVARRGTCLRRNYGAVIVNGDQIISTGYSGAARGARNCIDLKVCHRADAPKGQQYDRCRSVHAEMNAIIHASRRDMEGGLLYLACVSPHGRTAEGAEPCRLCRRTIINAGLRYVIVMQGDGEARKYVVENWVVAENYDEPDGSVAVPPEQEGEPQVLEAPANVPAQA